MAVEVAMPKFGLTMHDGTVQRYFKAVGQQVAAGEPLFEVETEKVMYEVEAPASGVLAIQLAAEGDTVECGVAVVIIAEPGEDLAALAARYGNGASAGHNHVTPLRAAQWQTPHLPDGHEHGDDHHHGEPDLDLVEMAFVEGFFYRIFYIIRRIEVRLSRAKAYHILSFSLEFPGFSGYGESCRRFYRKRPT